jgi:flagellar hook-basal body complex protein FliE
MPSFPWDQAVLFKSGFKLPTFVGTDLGSGMRDVNLGDFANAYQNAPPVFSGNALPANYAAQTPATSGAYPAGSPLGNVSQIVRDRLAYDQLSMPLQLELRQKEADITAAQQNKQLASLYPYLSQAGTEATQRALAASKAYRAFAEGLPSNVQNIMASKQNQAFTAAQGEAARAQAMAMQQQAANQSFGTFRGREISFG